MVFPVLQVPGFQHAADEPQEPLVTDRFRQDRERDLMVELPETVRDITLSEPHGPRPGIAYLPQRGMAPAPFPEPVRPARKPRLVDRLKNQADHLADQLI